MIPEPKLIGRPEDCLAGGGELGALMRSMDWSRTPLGPVASWPQSLRTSVSIMLASGFAVVVAWGPEHIFLYNDRYRPILGATKHPMALGSRGADIFPEIWEFVGPLFRKTLAGETVALDDVLLPLDRNGYLEECYFTLSYSPIRDESGGIGGLLAIVAETTERVRGVRRLRTLRDLASIAPRAHTAEEACENAARTLSENPTDVPFALLFLLDAEGETARLVGRTGIDGEVGTAAERWPLGEAARSGHVVVVDDVHDRFGALSGGTYPEPTRTALVLPLTRPGLAHPYGFLVAGVSPRRALDEGTRTFFELTADHVATAITNALSHEAERRRAEAFAEIDRAKTTFFSNVSHEFRTPLTLMLAPIEEMRTEHDGGDERLDLLHRNALRLLKLVNTLLEFSRIEAGRVQASYEPTDLAALTADLASSFRSAVERAGLRLVVECPSLPEPVYVDHDMWEKIVLNLLSNAFKFTFDGTITVRLRAVDEAVELEVEDTGVGIEEPELPRLFERFHRVEGARSRSHEGSGIGLALVQELVRAHGGEIRVESAVGRGTTFRIRVPRGTAHLPKEHIRAEHMLVSTATGAAPYVHEAMRWLAPTDLPPAAPVRAGSGPRERILVADDNGDMRDYIARLLRESWEVEAVGDGRAALDAMRRNPPDIVLADVMMPGLDGFALLRAVRSDPALRDTPVVLLSARAGEEATAEGLNAGADDYLVKPFTARELLVRVTTRLAASRQRANLYRAFMQAPFPVGIFRGPAHVVEAANEAILGAWGKDTSVVGRSLLEALPEIGEQPFPGLLDEVYRTGVAHEGRAELARLPVGPGGALEDAYFNYVYTPLRDSRGTVEGVMVCAFDVTAQIRAQETRFRLLVESVKDYAIFMLDPKGNVASWNAGAERIKGYTADEIVGRHFSTFYPADEAASGKCERELVIATEEGRFEEEGWRIRKDGSRFWANVVITPLRDAEGTFVGFAKVTRDLTQRRAAEENERALAREQLARAVSEKERQRLLTLLQQVPAIVNFLRGPDLVFEFAHPKTRQAAGGRDVLGKPLLVAIPEQRDLPSYAHLRHVYETGEPFPQHEGVAWFEIDGRKVERYWDSIYLPVRDSAGAIEGVMTFDLDVTGSVRARHELERANRAKDEFLATMSHELRTPLNAMLGWTTILSKKPRDEAKLERGLEVIERNVRTQERIVSDLLDVSRIISGKLQLTLRRTEVSGVVHAAAEVVRPAAEAKGVRLVVDLDPDIGANVVDPERLQQVIWNLLSNAVRYTPRGGRVTVTGERSGSVLFLRVQDTGSGIPLAHLPYIFDRFRQVDSSTTRSHGGLGLGLAIVRHLVEAHGGTVEAHSEGEGRGATFVVAMPIRALDLAVAETETGAGQGAETGTGTEVAAGGSIPPASLLRGVRVLVVDDDPDSLELVGVALGDVGAHVTSARSAREALAAPGPFDVIVSDIGMPEMDGYSFIHQARSRSVGGDVPAIALTAYARAEDAERAIRAGFQGHFAKPVDARRLLDAVEALSRARLDSLE